MILYKIVSVALELRSSSKEGFPSENHLLVGSHSFAVSLSTLEIDQMDFNLKTLK